MREGTTVLILTAILLLIGGLVYYIQMNNSAFNFYESELTINGSSVHETLSYQADKDYHTLFRSFQSPLSLQQDNISNSIIIKNVECGSGGTPYFNTNNNCYNNNSLIASRCLSFTEDNEYGCSFGNVYGFLQDGSYEIGADYEINPANLFRINNNYYIKFVAYGEGKHKTLALGQNLIINGEAISDKIYSPDEMVIIYIPYHGDISGFNVINQNGFEFDNKSLKHFFEILLFLLPGLSFFIVWLFFGKEDSSPDIPERLSMYPNKRKAWEVAAFFNHPLGGKNPNIVPTLLTDFYTRKIIDIQMKGKDLYIKISNYSGILDRIETDFMQFLKEVEKHSSKQEGYFKVKISELKFSLRQEISVIYSAMMSMVDLLGKEYFRGKGIAIFLFVMSAEMFLGMLINPIVSIMCFAFLFLIIIVPKMNLVLIKFKGDNYKEYLEWQAFKKFLSSSSLNLHGYKGTIVWGEFLVYATALGTAKRVLKEMKVQGIITEEQYNAFVVMSSPALLSSATGGFGGSSGGGGFGGAGGGGVGGGGGGGR